MFILVKVNQAKGIGETVRGEVMINVDDIICIKPYDESSCLITTRGKGELRAFGRELFERMTHQLVDARDDYTREP